MFRLILLGQRDVPDEFIGIFFNVDWTKYEIIYTENDGYYLKVSNWLHLHRTQCPECCGTTKIISGECLICAGSGYYYESSDRKG